MDAPDRRCTVLIVDDTPENISLLMVFLQDLYDIKAATRGQKALEIARSMPVDLILLDVMMPEMDGFETCRRLKADPMTRAIPVIFVTACGESGDESTGFSCGGVDYITKPINAAVVQTRVKTHLALYDQNRALEQLVRERTSELVETRLEILSRLGTAAEYRDDQTGMHIARVCHYSRIIALSYGLPENESELLFNAATLHDVGKIGVPDSILFKPGKLDDHEWIAIRQHCAIGHKIIGHHSSELLKAAADIALSHHEKWDGSGYPHRLKGTEISLFGRIVALADVFDALTSARPYKQPWSTDEAVTEITSCSGSHFDPSVVAAFMRQLAAIVEVTRTCSNESLNTA